MELELSFSNVYSLEKCGRDGVNVPRSDLFIPQHDQPFFPISVTVGKGFGVMRQLQLLSTNYQNL